MRTLLGLDQYPLDHPGSTPWQALAERCRANLASDAMFNLHGLMRQEIAERAVAEMINPFRDHAFMTGLSLSGFWQPLWALPAPYVMDDALARVIAVFSYYQTSGVLFSDQERIGFYGRAV